MLQKQQLLSLRWVTLLLTSVVVIAIHYLDTCACSLPDVGPVTCRIRKSDSVELM